MIVLVATTTAGNAIAFKVDLPPSAEDLRRMGALIDVSPGLVGAEWTGKEGTEVR